jgi:hypothetical protein
MCADYALLCAVLCVVQDMNLRELTLKPADLAPL